jgi:hypothetical protein
MTVGGVDGVKIREVGGSMAASGRTLYLNICGSVVIEEPTDKFGKNITGSRSVADGMSIPLIVGPARDVDADSSDATAASGIIGGKEKPKNLAVDVVVHPKILELSSKEKYFRSQIVDLALDWVIKESNIECDRKWSYLANPDVTYKGGRGENRDIPVLFFVDANGAPVSGTEAGTSSSTAGGSSGSSSGPTSVVGPGGAATGGSGKNNALSSTSSLLQQLNKEKNASNESANAAKDIVIGLNADKAKSTKSKAASSSKNGSCDGAAAGSVKETKKPAVLIQEIGAETTSLPLEETAQPVLPPPQQSTQPLLQEVKSKPLTSNSTTKSGAAVAAAVASSSVTVEDVDERENEATYPIVSGGGTSNITSSSSSSSSKPGVVPTKMECWAMDQLLRQCDEDFSSVEVTAGTGDLDQQLFMVCITFWFIFIIHLHCFHFLSFFLPEIFN